ncbi:YheT family hydrolase [Thalassolituus marinus]|uniref:Alpha/beta fold hydrolase n=1 Tax=Thalassolituus marinus TaxID=671053 RepID=A0ABS7ZT78_9GAMM|nr:alpha/beta fold hydrolase [Thalassolituus marinus]MCA6064881.1 alpha/beta fold hydrolase [Thalassolituus marinus]
MPVVESSYRAPWLLSNGYVQSILPSFVRRLDDSHLVRERIETDDGDFLDIDWSTCGSDTLVIVSHGLEGHSRRPYVLGTVREANRNGWDALAWNFRSCSGEMNRLPRMYHSGATDDLHRIVLHALTRGYKTIHLVGYSMGGNLSLVYAGREAKLLPPEVASVAAFSVPCDLRSSAWQLAKPANRIFMWRFLRDLREKIAAKAQRFPQQINLDGYDELRTFKQFDDRYTAPMHGFDDAEDYWQRSSSLHYLHGIRIPALLVNARNDPFLSPECFPEAIAREHDDLILEVPASGGHVGFMTWKRDHTYWMEQRAMAFFRQHNQRQHAEQMQHESPQSA